MQAKHGIFEKAKKIRELIFGKDITFYGVVYLWDKCSSFCIYCPGSVQNRERALKEGKAYPLKTLTVKEAIEEIKRLWRMDIRISAI